MNFLRERNRSWAETEEDEIPIKRTIINPRFQNKPILENQNLLTFLTTINENKDNEIREFDTISTKNEGTSLTILHYIYDPPIYPNIRGIVVEKNEENYSIKCKSFPYTVEVSTNEISVLKEKLDENMVVLKVLEGTLFRVWWYELEEKWYISTHRKIDSKNSRWGESPFGKLFFEIISEEELENLLDKRLCYSFLMSHPENRLVIPIIEKCLYHVATFDPEKNLIFYGGNLSETLTHPNIKYQQKLALNSWEEIKEYVDKLSWKEVGVMVTFNDNKFLPIKILNNKYTTKRELRGNEPNLRMRWLQCLKINSENQLEEMYPEKNEFWKELKEEWASLAGWLLGIYYEKYEKKNPEYLRIQREIFWVLESFRRKVNERKIEEFSPVPYTAIMNRTIERYNPRVINALIREMKKSS